MADFNTKPYAVPQGPDDWPKKIESLNEWPETRVSWPGSPSTDIDVLHGYMLDRTEVPLTYADYQGRIGDANLANNALLRIVVDRRLSGSAEDMNDIWQVFDESQQALSGFQRRVRDIDNHLLYSGSNASMLYLGRGGGPSVGRSRATWLSRGVLWRHSYQDGRTSFVPANDILSSSLISLPDTLTVGMAYRTTRQARPTIRQDFRIAKATIVTSQDIPRQQRPETD